MMSISSVDRSSDDSLQIWRALRYLSVEGRQLGPPLVLSKSLMLLIFDEYSALLTDYESSENKKERVLALKCST